MNESFLPHAAKAAIESATEARLEQALSQAQNDQSIDLSDLRNAVGNRAFDDTTAIGMSVHDQLRLVEHHASDYGIEDVDTTVTSLRSWIEQQVVMIVNLLAESAALEVIDDLAEAIDTHGLEDEALRLDNPHETWRHYGEREEYPWHVYEYRNLEGEGLHVDLFEYQVGAFRVYLEHWLERGSLSLAEEHWDASGTGPDGRSYEWIRSWRHDHFRLELFDTGTIDRHGKSLLAYEFHDARYGSEPLFQGADFRSSLLHAIDSDATVWSLLSFLSLRPGDTDAEHFAEYSDRQREWCAEHAEELGFMVATGERLSRWQQLHENGQTLEAVLEVAKDGQTEDLFEVLNQDVFATYDLVIALWEKEHDARLEGLIEELHHLQCVELAGSEEELARYRRGE